jgi:hypothetical protein
MVSAYDAFLPLTPDKWAAEQRILTAGVSALVAGVAVYRFLQTLLTPLRRLTRKHTSSANGQTSAPATVPSTLNEALHQVESATATDAARRAASRARFLDLGEEFLCNANRWTGYTDGEATFYLAPGFTLHFRNDPKYSQHEFTLITAASDEPVRIASLAQIRHILSAHAAGLPTSRAADDMRSVPA